MRQYIDAVQRLFEADIIPFPDRPPGKPAGDFTPEVVPFPTQKRAEAVNRDRQRYRLVVLSLSPGEPKKRPVDVLDGMNAGEVAVQLANYHPVERKGNTWISHPTGDTTYYMHVMVNGTKPSEPELQQIEDQMMG